MAYTPDFVTINIDLPDIADAPVLASVGQIYDIGINGQGYMIVNDPTRDILWRRGTVNLDPERLATTETPLDESINRYTFASIGDFSGGAGQRFRDRDDSTGTGYFQSSGIDPFTEAPMAKLLHTVENPASGQTTYSNPLLATAAGRIFMLTADNALTYWNGSSWSSVTGITDTAGAVVISGLTSDGNYWYAATGASVVRGTTSNPGANWASVAATDVQWAAGRICAAVKNGSSVTPNQFATLGPDGVDEQGIGVGHLTLDEGHTVKLGGTASGYYYFGSTAGEESQLWAWQLGLDQGGGFYAPFVAWDMPPGLTITGVYASEESVFVAASDGVDNRLYRCVPGQDGNVTPFFVTDFTLSSTVRFSAYQDLVFWTWDNMGTYSGIGAYSLKSGGFATWYETADSANTPVDIAVYDGQVMFSLAGKGLYWPTSSYVSSGQIILSIADGSSGLDKVWDFLTVVSLVLPASTSIATQFSVDNGNSFFNVGTFDTAGTTMQTFPITKKAQSGQGYVQLNSDGTSTPYLVGVSARYHPLGLTDRVLVLPVDCGDNLTGLNGRPLPAKAGSGAERARELEDLSQTRVQVQDIDYAFTGLVETFEVVQVESTGVTIHDPHTGKIGMRLIATVTLRKPK
jgi:hypothetical protein